MTERVQRKRTPGWKMPPNTVYVGRGSKWGNPFTFANSEGVHPAVRFACEVAPMLDVTPLIGKNLACWCRIDQECHADSLLEFARFAAPAFRPADGEAVEDENEQHRKGQ